MPLPNQVLWSVLDNDMGVALGTATGNDLAIGTVLRANLQALGLAYDAAYVAAVETSKAAGLASYAAALAAWSAPTLAAHNQADHATRAAEQEQVTASTGVLPEPLVYGGRVLAPTTAITWTTPESPTVAATLTLSSKLRIDALAAGAAGNSITVAVADATDANANHCKLTVALGSYSVVYDNLDPATSPAVSSLLVRLTWLVAARPVNAAAAPLAGGTGGTHTAILARLDAAARLPAVVATPGLLGVLAAHRARIVTAQAGAPTLRYNGAYVVAQRIPDGNPMPPAGAWLQRSPHGSKNFVVVQALEAALVAAKDDGQAWLDAFNAP